MRERFLFPAAHRPTTDRTSCAWRDAIGPGFVTGVNDRLLDAVAGAAISGYCR